MVAVAVAFGLLGGIVRPSLFEVGVGRELEERAAASVGGRIERRLPTWRRNLVVLVVGLAAWLVPIAAVALWRKDAGTFADMGWFFSKAALVTFGGAYAVLAYVDQAAVGVFGWLRPGQMAVGLGLAESTPGPLIMVLEFVGFVGAYQHPGGLPPVVAGHPRRDRRGVGDVRAVLPVGLPRRSVRRADPRQRPARVRPADRDGGGRRRHREPGGHLRAS